MKKTELEITRHNITPSAFMAYLRKVTAEKGITETSDLTLEWLRSADHWTFKNRYTVEQNPFCEAESGHDEPYSKQTYCKCRDGSLYNEIIEFDFDNAKTGAGYYYLLNII